MSKFAVNNNIPIIRNIVYKRINDILKDIKETTPEMSDFFIEKCIDQNFTFGTAAASIFEMNLRII